MQYNKPQKDPAEVQKTRNRMAGAPVVARTVPDGLSSFANPDYKPLAETSTEGGATSPSPRALTPEQEQVAQANRARRAAMAKDFESQVAKQHHDDEMTKGEQELSISSPHDEGHSASGPMKVDASKNADADLLK